MRAIDDQSYGCRGDFQPSDVGEISDFPPQSTAITANPK
jgi:hypothetical protein